MVKAVDLLIAKSYHSRHKSNFKKVGMYESALEREIRTFAQHIKAVLASRDRGVIWAVLLGIVPIPPVALIGLSIGLFNFWLWKNKKLDYSEGRLIRLSILLGLVTFIASSFCFYLLASAIYPQIPIIFYQIIGMVDTIISNLFELLGKIFHAKEGQST